ncbi:hypothetical protein OIV83_000784 [Microbotryomycetes sp. JL201]|nr:hypothetical protein OIV83_000784 [Microbotryomycetes sp. JL201]
MSLTDEQKRERMSKAMGAAFLSHTVAQLEKSVDSLAFSRDQRLYGDFGERGRHVRGAGAASRGRGGGDSAQRGTGTHTNGQSVRSAGARERRIVDASALVHALPVLKRWVRQDTYQLIVPLQALSTLDILKKAPNPLHDLARDATKFLESQFNIARQIEATLGTKEANARVRLRAQSANEELGWKQVEHLFQIPEGFEIAALQHSQSQTTEVSAGEQDEPRIPVAADIPRALRSTIQCALHFNFDGLTTPVVLYKNGAFTNPYAAVQAANADMAASTNERRGEGHRDHHQQQQEKATDFDAIASGDALSFWLSTFLTRRSESDDEQYSGVAVDVVSKSEVQAARAWFKEMAASAATGQDSLKANQSQRAERGEGRGRGSGARGRGKTRGRGRGANLNNAGAT